MSQPTDPTRPPTRRDDLGIPHLLAGSADELAFAQGANAATDRAWQVDVERWRARGRTAELLGPAWLGWDTFARQARLDDTARRCFATLEPETQRWFTVFVAGVNSALPQGRSRAREYADAALPAADAGWETWSPWDPLGVFLVQHVLFGSFPAKLWRSQVLETLGPDWLVALSSEGPSGSGSNAWVVTGERTRSGRPMIAGDPHRVIEAPGVYQQVRLTCTDPQDAFDVVGFAFPGVPGIPHFGHAGDVAWAITNAMGDYQDLFVEELVRRGEAVMARGVDGEEPVDRTVERVLVRGGDAVEVECLETPRGPVVVGSPGGPGPVLSLRTPTRAGSDLGLDALLGLLRARTADDVVTAMGRWVEPVNSAVIADVTGAVRTQIAGRVPLRDKANRRSPVPAWDDRHAWTGYAVAGDGLLGSVVEPGGLAVTANDRRWDTQDLGDAFAAPHRGRRIRELLGERTDLDVDAMHAIHLDVQLGTAPALQSLLAGLELDDLPDGSAALRDRLVGWDGHLHADDPTAGAFAAWRTELVRRLSADPALAPLSGGTAYAPLFDAWTALVPHVAHALESLLVHGPGLGLDVAGHAAQALSRVATSGTADEAWGGRHVFTPVQVTPDGAASQAIPVVGLGGDGDCVRCTHSIPGASDACLRGPVARYVWDLADRDASAWIVPLGSSGVDGDAHHHDQLDQWAHGGLAPVVGPATYSHNDVRDPRPMEDR